MLKRLLLGKQLIDHARSGGARAQRFGVAAVHEVVAGPIRAAWFYAAG